MLQADQTRVVMECIEKVSASAMRCPVVCALLRQAKLMPFVLGCSIRLHMRTRHHSSNKVMPPCLCVPHAPTAHITSTVILQADVVLPRLLFDTLQALHTAVYTTNLSSMPFVNQQLSFRCQTFSYCHLYSAVAG